MAPHIVTTWAGPREVRGGDGVRGSTPTPMDTPTKTCGNPKCRKVLPATPEFFHRNRGGMFGLDGQCKPCKRSKVANRYAADERRAASGRPLPSAAGARRRAA